MYGAAGVHGAPGAYGAPQFYGASGACSAHGYAAPPPPMGAACGHMPPMQGAAGKGNQLVPPPPPPRPVRPVIPPGMDPVTGIVWPGGKRPAAPIVKASNLAEGITTAALKQAVGKWGVEGIKEVLLTQSRWGQVALFLFKDAEHAELMMMAQGIEVEGRPLMLHFLPASVAAVKAGERKSGPSREARQSTGLVRVSGLPKKLDKDELVTHLRSHGVLGIAQVVLQKGRTAIVAFNEVKDVKKAISKAHNTAFKDVKVTLEPCHEEWDELFPDGEWDEWDEEDTNENGNDQREGQPVTGGNTAPPPVPHGPPMSIVAPVSPAAHSPLVAPSAVPPGALPTGGPTAPPPQSSGPAPQPQAPPGSFEPASQLLQASAPPVPPPPAQTWHPPPAAPVHTQPQLSYPPPAPAPASYSSPPPAPSHHAGWTHPSPYGAWGAPGYWPPPPGHYGAHYAGGWPAPVQGHYGHPAGYSAPRSAPY
eukprot:TRINITY_DN113917_c0_g1_i1.p1 TRINITY_DN113917_c0_g1~~TRINITY_DN113917_c0_g1_i1.p1  ORF type:complete len:491 (-),score=86.34 TRINITY_DN113917_c0_g1_i1:38-1468(-)